MNRKNIFIATLVLSFALHILYGQNHSIYGIDFYDQNGLEKNQRACFKEYLLALENIPTDDGRDSLAGFPLLASERYSQTPLTGFYHIESITLIKNNFYISRGHLLRKRIFIIELYSADRISGIPYHIYILSPKDKSKTHIALKIGNTYKFDLRQIGGIDYRDLTSSKTPVGDGKTLEPCFYKHYYIARLPLKNRIYFESTNLNGIHYHP